MSAVSTRAAALYQETRIQSSSPLELVVLLYDGALKYIGMARRGMVGNDGAARREGVSRALAIVSELQTTLNLTEGGDLARSLDALYTYVSGRLVDANVRSDPAGLDEAARLLTTLREGWVQVAASTQSASVPHP